MDVVMNWHDLSHKEIKDIWKTINIFVFYPAIFIRNPQK